MAKSLFDHIKAITQDQKIDYWDTLEDADKKSWSNYMIHRFLSMNSDWIEVLSEIQPYTQTLEPKQLYLALIGIIPKGRYFLKYSDMKDFTNLDLENLEEWVTDEIDNRERGRSPATKERILRQDQEDEE